MPEKHFREVCLIGWPVAHSLSPYIHQTAFEAFQMTWRYTLLPIQPAFFIQEIKRVLASDLLGFNVTAPYKEMIISYLDDCDEQSLHLQSVNTVMKTKTGQWVGYNTDSLGFKRAIDRLNLFETSMEHIAIMGNGGVVRALLDVLLERPIRKIEILARDLEKTRRLMDHIIGYHKVNLEITASLLNEKNLSQTLQTAAMLINATPVGMTHVPQKSLITDDMPLTSTLKYLDLIYSPAETHMMHQVSKAGGKAWNGLEMLIAQAGASFEIWTGREAPLDIMKDAVMKRKLR